ncbi:MULTISPECIES: Spx/MgsR family RNA polymerase-binding regulatory protein [unclassified Neochlamydia]|uniref:Spx/MgsR family RNA polymerase-binding regulatory protein n=1 Tax=unclassified Neochlamydia TaxID=2643326 RepID=UPI0014090AE1|nr:MULTISPECIES: Spx/MgsR family RNA polymerase-binding regulatory protein [unclassified Neochlamydia]MBS4170348.1 Uncharacterized protein YusI [Neochlamydia sp. AcF95]NGY94502.1 hypothetical protein [Neochlamydia sp. AcF84]
MSVLIYLHVKCSTCQKALRFLDKADLSYTAVDIVQSPPSLEELNKMLAYYKGDIKKLFNSSGRLYKELQLSQKLPYMPQNEALSLLHAQGMLVKRPFLLGDGIGLVGFQEEHWKHVFLR